MSPSLDSKIIYVNFKNSYSRFRWSYDKLSCRSVFKTLNSVKRFVLLVKITRSQLKIEERWCLSSQIRELLSVFPGIIRQSLLRNHTKHFIKQFSFLHNNHKIAKFIFALLLIRMKLFIFHLKINSCITIIQKCIYKLF